MGIKVSYIGAISKVSLLLFMANLSWAGSIIGVNLLGSSDDNRTIKINFDKKRSLPKVNFNQQQNQIELDFIDTSLKLNNSSNAFNYNDHIVSKILFSDFKKDSKITVILKDYVSYQLTEEKQSILLKVKKNNEKQDVISEFISNKKNEVIKNPVEEEIVRKESVLQQNRENNKKDPVSIHFPLSVDFRKGEHNTGIIVLNIASGKNKPEFKMEGNRLLLTFRDYYLNSNSKRIYDVNQFSTLVEQIKVSGLGNNALVEINNKDSWKYRVEDFPSQFIVYIEKKSDFYGDSTLNLKPKEVSYSGKKVSLDFQDIEVRTILQILAKESGMNIIASDSVTGKMTVNLENVNWDQALDLVLKSRSLAMRKYGNIINVAPRRELENQDKQALLAEKELNELGVLESQIFKIKYKMVEDFKEMLDNSSSKDKGSTMLSNRGNIMIDKNSNSLIITDIRPVINKFERLINELDVAKDQVLIEARIVEANEGFSRDLGIKLGSFSAKNSHSFAGINHNTKLKEDDPLPLNINLPAAAATSGFTILRNTATAAVGLELTAMQSEGKGKIVSAPKVLTQDRQEAVLEEGEDFPYQESTSSGATSTTFKKAVTGIKVIPQITPDGNVIMRLEINKNSVKDPVTGAMSVQRVDTTAMVQDGGTIVVGGIYVEENLKNVDKVPFLGDLPLIGNAFKRTTKIHNRREMLVFITPKIVRGVDVGLTY